MVKFRDFHWISIFAIWSSFVRTWYNENKIQRVPFEGYYRREIREKILLSIGMITYKRPGFLKFSIEALLPQIGSSVELVIVVDGFDQETLDVLSLYKSPFIRVFLNKDNQGRPRSRNQVIKESYGEFILWVDDDDIAKPDLVSSYIDLISEHGDIDVAYCDLEIYDDLNRKKPYVLSAENISGCGAEIIQNLISNKGITFGASIVRRSFYIDLGGFDERMNNAQDNEFWYRAALHGRFFKVHKTLYTYRLHSGNTSSAWKSDTSYASFALRNALKHIPLETIFPDYDWELSQHSVNKALSFISNGLASFKDYYNAVKFLTNIPVEQISVDDAISLIRYSLIIGNRTQVSIAYEVLNKSHNASRSTLISIKSFIEKVYNLEHSIDSAYNNRKIDKLKYYLREYHKIFRFSFFSSCLIAKRFIDINDIRKAYRSYYFALMLQPNNVELVNWMEANASYSSPSNSFSDLRKRMLGDSQSEPIYILNTRKMNMYTNHYFPDVRSIFNSQRGL